MAATPTGAADAVSEPAWAAYVRDPAGFQWKLNSKTVRPNGTTYCEVSLTSQVWQGATWTHPLQVLLPPKSAAPDTAVIFVNGVPGGSETLPQWVADTGVVCAVVGGIYQPCFGVGGGEQIATYSFKQYAATGDPNWVVMAPVVKSLVRTMDALCALAEKERGAPLQRFILTGFSKMGMACWLTAALDARVAGIVPVGADAVNLPAQFEVSPGLFGGMANVDSLKSEPGRKFLALVDPYIYRARLVAPKLVVSGSNDEHYGLSAVSRYWDGLPGPKWNLYLDNADHTKEPNNPKTVRATAAFVRAVATGHALPQVAWNCTEADGRVRVQVTTTAPAQNARLWTCATAGEFKFAKWSAQPLAASARDLAHQPSFSGDVAKPAAGRLAAYAEVEFANADGTTFPLTSGVWFSRP